MKKQLIAMWVAVLMLGGVVNVKANDCISGHWLSKKSADGSIIILEDGSTWQIDSIDRISTILWLPTDSILVCEGDGTLINTDDGEKVYARRLQ